MKTKRLTVLAGTGVLLYCLIVYPTQLAHGVQTTLGWLTTGAESVITFIQNVFG